MSLSPHPLRPARPATSPIRRAGVRTAHRAHGAAVAALAAVLALSACAGEGEAPGGGTAPDGTPTPLAIRNVTVIDAVDGAREGQTVVVEGDRITAVGGEVEIPGGAEVVDGTGRYLIPGLWDMHVHLTYDDGLTAAMPRLFLSWGVTSVRDTGGLLHELLPVVEAMREEGAVAPRVFFSGPLLDGEFVVYDGEGRPEIGTGNPTPEAARENVAALKEAGVDFIKIYEMVSPEVFEALVEAGNEHGLPMAAHVPLALRARQVAPRVNSMEHLRNVEMDCASDPEGLLAARREVLAAHDGGPGGDLRSSLHRLQRLPAIAAYDPARCREVLATMGSTVQVPTLRLNAMSMQPPFPQADWLEALERAPSAVAADWRAATERALAEPAAGDTTFGAWSLSLVARMHEAGVPIGAGTDTPIGYALPGYSLHDELAMLVRAGLSPLEALRSATLRPASFFGMDDEMGRVAPGQRGDLVLLSADPLEDIANTREIDLVVTRGRAFTPGELTPPVR